MPSERSFFDWTLFKKNFTRYWPIWASYLTVWMFIMPFSLIMENGLDREDFVYSMGSFMEFDMVFAIAYGLAGAMAVMSHLYSARSANFFGALPVRREGIFVTQFVSGFAFVAVPNLVIASVTAVVGLVAGAGPDVMCAFYWFAHSCGETFFFYALAVLCGMLTGHILALPAFYAVSNFIFIGLGQLIEEVLRDFYFGFVGLSDGFIQILYWLTPAYMLSNVGRSVSFSDKARVSLTLSGWYAVGIYVLVAVVFAVISLLLYRKRRLESAGDVVAIKPLRPVFKYGVAMCAGLVLGFVCSEIFGDVTMIFFAILWGVAGFFIAQMILDKTFRVFGKWRGALAVAAAFGAVFAVIELDLTGFESRVPALEDVESMEIHSLGYMYGRPDSAYRNDFTVTDPEDISRFRDLHIEALDGGVGYYSSFPYDIYTMNYSITYHTRSGDISRRYRLTYSPEERDIPGTTAYTLNSLFKDRDLFWHIYGFDSLESWLGSGGRLERVTYEFNRYMDHEESFEDKYVYFANDEQLQIVEYSHMLELFEAVKADFWAGNIGLYTLDAEEEEYEIRGLYFTFPTGDGDNWKSVDISVSDRSENTIRAIERIIPEELRLQGVDGTVEGSDIVDGEIYK